MENKTVRTAARVAGVPLWRVADEVGISEPTISRWLRRPLSQEREDMLLAAINRLSEEVPK